VLVSLFDLQRKISPVVLALVIIVVEQILDIKSHDRDGMRRRVCRFSFRWRGTAREKGCGEENGLFHITLAGVLFAVEAKYCCALTFIKLKRKGAAEATPD
jgi:hypothetical protein